MLGESRIIEQDRGLSYFATGDAKSEREQKSEVRIMVCRDLDGEVTEFEFIWSRGCFCVSCVFIGANFY